MFTCDQVLNLPLKVFEKGSFCLKHISSTYWFIFEFDPLVISTLDLSAFAFLHRLVHISCCHRHMILLLRCVQHCFIHLSFSNLDIQFPIS